MSVDCTLSLFSSWSKVEPALARRAMEKQPERPVTISPEKHVTEALVWTVLRVSEWIRDLGFPQYVVSQTQT